MIIRTALAALNNNHNVGRQQATIQAGDLRYKVVYPNGRKDWVAQPITEVKSYDYIAAMLTKVVEACHKDMSMSALEMTAHELQPSSQLIPNITDVP